MKKLATLASDVRINALLCCSAAVLLTACGGGSADSVNGQHTQTAAQVIDSGANAGATGTEAGADLTLIPAAADETPVAAPDFELKGYATNPLTEKADDSETPQAASQPAPANGAPRLLAASVATPATTYNYYVSPNGSDSAAGTKAAPFKTLARAAKAATKPSTTVWVAPGTYAGGIKTTGNGTASNRIYWVSTTKWGAKVVPPASSSTKSAWDNRGNYVSIIGFDVDGSKIGSGT